MKLLKEINYNGSTKYVLLEDTIKEENLTY